jgi:hypothetical protein
MFGISDAGTPSLGSAPRLPLAPRCGKAELEIITVSQDITSFSRPARLMLCDKRRTRRTWAVDSNLFELWELFSGTVQYRSALLLTWGVVLNFSVYS